jgi:trans-aconitate methyltransferase
MLAALSSFGFRNLHGVDLSPDDIEKAKALTPHAHVTCEDAIDYLEEQKTRFDIIILKALLEHTPKPQVLRLLEGIRESLSPRGIVIIDVPNMDWLFAPHERYMDFTHEIGFTTESLRQTMNNVFCEVRIEPVDHLSSGSLRDRLRQRFARFFLGKLLLWADEQGAKNPIWARSLIGVGTKCTKKR